MHSLHSVFFFHSDLDCDLVRKTNLLGTKMGGHPSTRRLATKRRKNCSKACPAPSYYRHDAWAYICTYMYTHALACIGIMQVSRPTVAILPMHICHCMLPRRFATWWAPGWTRSMLFISQMSHFLEVFHWSKPVCCFSVQRTIFMVSVCPLYKVLL